MKIFIGIVLAVLAVGGIAYLGTRGSQPKTTTPAVDTGSSSGLDSGTSRATASPDKPADACSFFGSEDMELLSNPVVKKALPMNQDSNCTYEYTAANGVKSVAMHLWVMYYGKDTSKFMASQFPEGLVSDSDSKAISGIGSNAALIRPWAPAGMPQEAKVVFVVEGRGVLSLSVSEPGTFEQNAEKAKSIAATIAARLAR